MKIEWNKVTWYSKIFAVLLFVVVFFVGFQCGALYQIDKDLASSQLLLIQPSLMTTTTDQIPKGVATTTKIPPGVITNCGNDTCPTGYSCMAVGPLIAGQPQRSECVQKGQAAPL